MQTTQATPKYKKSLIYLNKTGVQKYRVILSDAYKIMFTWLILGGLSGYVNYRFILYLPFVRKNPRRLTIQWIASLLPALLITYNGYKLMQYKRLKGLIELTKDSSCLMDEQKYRQSLRQSYQQY